MATTMVRCTTTGALVLIKASMCVLCVEKEVCEEINDFKSEREVNFFSASGDDDPVDEIFTLLTMYGLTNTQ